MRKNLLIFIIIVFSLPASTSVFAAPAPEYFVINEQNRQCGIYWPGDEFSQYELPSGWEIYEPEPRIVLETPFGSCDFEYDVRKISEDQAQQKYYEQCCEKLGFNYINHYDNPISYNKNMLELDGRQWYCSPKIGKEKYQGLLLNDKTHECRPLIGFNLYGVDRGMRTPTDKQCYLTDNNWTAYEYPVDEKIYQEIINTPFGQCIHQKYPYDSCCEKLGLKNVGRDLVATANDNNIEKNNKDNRNDIIDNKQQKSNIIPIVGISAVVILLLIILWFFLIKRK